MAQPGPGPHHVGYGPDPSQVAELWLPEDTPRGVVVVIHGGFWRAAYDLSLGWPLAADLVRHGWAALNVEYRRVGNGGGAPRTLDDVAAAIDILKDTELDLSTVVTLGHSAGGHLAAWAASRLRFERWAGGVPVTAVISQAGVLDLVAGHEERLGDGAVQEFLGRPPGPEDVPADPRRQLPLDVPLWCVHPVDDDVVPLSQSRSYVEAARAAGATAELVEVPGDHMIVLDTEAEAWSRTLAVLDRLDPVESAHLPR